MPLSTLTLEQRVASYASDVIRDFDNLKAMKILVETHFARASHDPRDASARIPVPPRRGAVLETGIKKAALAVVLASPADIGRDGVLRKLEREGFPFSAKDPEKAVGDALQRLSREDKIVKVIRGRGSKLNLYRKPQ